MTKYIAFFGLFVTTSLFTACSSSDMPIQHADDYGYITFSAQTEKVASRTNPYENYSPSKHPATMGVFGYHDLSSQEDQVAQNTIFNNETTSYDATTANWQTTSRKKWNEYMDAKTFDFFAYMPLLLGAHVATADNLANAASGSTSSYTLTIPFSMPTGSCYLTGTQQAPIICALPDHKQATSADGTELAFERVVKLKFDQTLTAYQLLFRLDSKMGAIRQFRIKAVTLSGNIVTSGTISRTYTWNSDNSEWTAANIQWTDLTRMSDTDAPISVPYQNTASSGENGEGANNQSVVVTSSGYTQWGGNLYMIPDASFLPTITVKYDVEFVAEDGETVITRKDMTSSIVLNKTNFSGLTAGGIAMINPVRILIQPRYLYVMADQDAYTGHLLVE